MSELTLKNSLASHALVFGLIKKLVCFIKEIDNHNDLKMNPELTKAILDKVNEIISDDNTLTNKQKKTINKNTILLEALKQSFNLTEEEITFIEKQIEFIADNKMIKKKYIIKKINKVSSYVFNSIKK